MDLQRLKRNWDAFGRRDPLWAVLALPDKRGNRWDVEEFFAWGRDEIEGVLEYVRSRGLEIPSGRALDFGCGVGRLTQALALHFENVDGVDIAPSMIRLAERYNRHPTTCRYHLNDRADLGQFPDSSFDFIYSNITLQHIEPRYSERYISEFVRLLSERGALVFQVPSEPVPGSVKPPGRSLRKTISPITPAFLRPALRWIVDRRSPSMEGFGIPRTDVIRLLEEAGAKVVDVQPDTWSPDWIAYRYCVTRFG
jgi:SAM-dependent methyltransferase